MQVNAMRRLLAQEIEELETQIIDKTIKYREDGVVFVHHVFEVEEIQQVLKEKQTLFYTTKV